LTFENSKRYTKYDVSPLHCPLCNFLLATPLKRIIMMLNILITPSQIFRCRPNKTEIRTPHPQYFKYKTTFCRMSFYHLPTSENCKVRSLMSIEFCNEYHKFHLQMINIHVFGKHFESVKFTSTVFILKVLYFRHILKYMNSRNI
jgi:hypothetical protein